MQSRVSKLLHGSEGHGLRVSTFHSLGLDILRKEHKVLGYKASITLFDEYDKITILKSLFTQKSAITTPNKLNNSLRKLGNGKMLLSRQNKQLCWGIYP